MGRLPRRVHAIAVAGRYLAVAVGASRGLLDYDTRVAEYWPDFAQAGKADITVRQLLSHQAGLVAVDPPLTISEIADPEVMTGRIAKQAPAWPPGTRHGYHAVTLGWYESALIRQVDPQRRTVGRFLADEIAAPLDLDLFIGVPASIDRERIARLKALPVGSVARHDHGTRRRQAVRRRGHRRSRTGSFPRGA